LPSHRARTDTPEPAFVLQKILVPVDFSAASRNAHRYALRLAAKFGAELTLFYVLTPTPVLSVSGISVAGSNGSDRASAEENLQAMTGPSRTGAAKTRCVTRPGVPSHEIVEFAKESGTDLIVMATHGYTGWKHFCIGSTAERVVRAAPCPVLVVREKEHDLI
jgi:universal stress protein A